MKKLLLALALLLAPASAFASCSGTFQASQFCGSVAGGVPGPVAFTAISGNAITALTGDGTAAGPGSVPLTLATVNANTGTFGSATSCVTVTNNAKGLTTAVSAATCTPAIGSITGLAAGIATFLATPSSANLAAAVTDETGSGALVFANAPTLIGPTLGNAIATSLTNPLDIGGSGTTGTQKTFKTTTGNGTTDAFAFNGGNNGATNFANISALGQTLGSSATAGVSTATPVSLDLGATFSSTPGSHAKLLMYHDNAANQSGLGISASAFEFIALTGTGFNFYSGPSTLLGGISPAGNFGFTGSILSSGAGGVGYTTGAGCAVTQLTSRTTTTPACNKPSGDVTLFSAAAVVGTYASFVVSNTTIAASDTVSLSFKSTTNTYNAVIVAISAGVGFTVSMGSVAGTATDSPVLHFNVIKGVNN